MDSQLSTQGLSSLLSKLYDLPLAQVTGARQFQSLRSRELAPNQLLEAIPTSPNPSFRPLHLLHLFLEHLSGPWPTLDLIRCQTRLLKSAPKDGRETELKWVVIAVEDFIKKSYSSFSDFIGQDKKPALRSTDSNNYVTHRGLSDFVRKFQLPPDSTPRIPTVAIALPNGPLLAATCVAAATYYTAAPINPAAGPEQFRADVAQSGAKFILTTPADYNKLELKEWTVDAGVTVIFMGWSHGDIIEMQTMDGRSLLSEQPTRLANGADDIALILFTSGTSGTKKVVPLTTHSMIAGIVFVMDSWGLTPNDICLNMMPLYHVGGLVRNIFAPIFSGGSTVCCSAFDPNMFWDLAQDISPTWYYASPSMHSVILSEATSRPQALEKCRIRLACNAAGGLLPSLACQLRDTFNCVVLPSYGMTECMPISTPPLDYKLDREGTSGISTGPDITILDWSENSIPCGTVGRICVRGEPVFHGYLKPDGTLDKSPFNSEGWFDTGDLGYMDSDGYLFITGRSKEVINRGGELISPFEVENAIMSASLSEDSPIKGRVSQVLAFSAVHDVLQEVVAVALVTPPSKPRADLKALHEALRSSLQQVKWPVMITYMNDLPKKNNKVLRIKLGQRLGLPSITDEMPHLERHLEATCPPPDTDLSVSIPCEPCAVNRDTLARCLNEVVPADLSYHCSQDTNNGSLTLFIAPTTSRANELSSGLGDDIRAKMSLILDGYMLPSTIHLMQDPFVRDDQGVVDELHLAKALAKLQQAVNEKLSRSTEGQVTKAFADILSMPPDAIPHNADFFSLGGDSLGAGRLVSALRSAFNVPLSINLMFSQGTVKAIAAHIEGLSGPGTAEDENKSMGCTTTRSSTNPFLMLLQLCPLAILYPMRRAFQWTIFIVVFAQTQEWPTNDSIVGRLFNLTFSIMVGRVIVRFIAPFLGILSKWVIIGRYREGLYPMWGLYHTRWWLVEKIVAISGKGFFSSNDFTRLLYCRLMGARIGKGVKIAGASLGEWDLLDIKDGATLTNCVCRPFAAEANTSMYLGRITVGENSYIGTSSIVAAGSTIPPHTCIGANSSSWEAEDADERNRDLSPSAAAKPHWALNLLFTLPLSFISWFASLMPWFAGLVGMIISRPPVAGSSPLRSILEWFTAPQRVGYHYLALVLRTLLAPFVIFGFALLVKLTLDAVFGKLRPEPARSKGAVATWRASLIKTLLPVSRLHDVTGMFGQHYEATSIAVRLLGGKIGKRVYWPGTGPSIGDYHLLDIGNDVVFGSRSHLITSDGLGSDIIKIRDRAMIADRVCLLPGVDIGERTTMGSGALTKRNNVYPAGGTYVGSKAGDSVCLTTGKDPDLQQARRQPRSRYQQMGGSEVTLTEDKHAMSPRTPTTPQGKIHYMSSDDTLNEIRKDLKKEKVHPTASPLFVSSSSSELHKAESNEDASPFGRAFYMGLAPYYVLGPFAIFCYSSFLTIIAAFYWNVPNISSIQIVEVIINRFIPAGTNMWLDVLALFLMNWVVMAILTTAQAAIALAVVISSKWLLLGRRMPGNYDWDKSPYCQRWQMFLCIEKLRRSCYRGHGILGMLTGTSWIAFYFRALGANIGKDCALFANGRPSLMFTEPDLITLGDRVVVDDASVVGHINTRGKFDLNRLEIGDRCVLRTGSRLLSGATMKNDSCLLEHTLIMGGDVVESNWTMQGWPAERYFKRRALSRDN